MKKFFIIAVIIIIIIAVVLAIIYGLPYFSKKIQQDKLNYERINNSTTLSLYMKNHDQEHIAVKDKSINFLSIEKENISCDDLFDNHKILYYSGYDDGILILDDYSIYETVFGSEKLYSNNKQYKKIDLDINIKRIQIQYNNVYLISDNNEYYLLNSKSITKHTLSEFGILDNLLKDETIKNVIAYRTNTQKNCNEYYVLKTDGQIYLQEYNYLSYNSFIKETLYLSSDIYGKITDAEYGQFIRNTANSGIDYKNLDIIKIVSDNGFYYLKPIQTEDSKKYVDIEPKYEMTKSEIYNKYKDDIIFINCTFIFTKDHNIIRTNYLCNDLDKDIK